ncbi:MAG: pyridoxal-phosphate dependent enzyme [Candidatus Pacearchaeota archaeon]
METKRRNKYRELKKRILNTPLDKYEGEVPNKNNIWIKNVADSEFGSHYDLSYLKLFEHYENLGKIKPGDKVFESTSGSAGVSMVNIGKELGYECHIAMPAGGEKARENAILNSFDKDKKIVNYNPENKDIPIIENNTNYLILTPKDKYVNGFMDLIKPLLVKNRDIFFLNHSMGKAKDMVNEVTLQGMENIAKESMRELDNLDKGIDYFIPAVGNGSSILGPGRALNSNTRVIAFEPFQAALAYDLIHPGKYKELYGIEPGTLPRSLLPGTSFSIKGDHVPTPHIREAVDKGILEDVVLVSDWQMDENYKEFTGNNLDAAIPRWHTEKYKDFGRSTRAGIAVAKKLAKNTKNKNYLLIGYDKMSRYDDQR